MSNINEHLNTDIVANAQFKEFAENLVRFILHHDLSFDEALSGYTQYRGFDDQLSVFSSYYQMRSAILVLDGVYRIEAKKVFDGIEKENINIHWFTEHAIFKRETFFRKGVDYQICLHFCVYLAILATYLYHHGIEGILDIAAQHIAVLFSSIAHTNEMEPLNIVVQKFATLYHKRKHGLLPLNRASTSTRMESEIVGEHHQYANEIMDRQEVKENLIPIQTFPFCDKSPTSSSEPVTRQMHLGNSRLDFTAIPGTSRDANTAADYPCSQSQSMLATNMAFKRRVSNEWGESEHNCAKKGKTDYIVSNNRVVKNFGDINMDYNAICSDDSD